MTRLLRLAAIALALIAGFVARAGDASAAGAVRPCIFCEIVAGRLEPELVVYRDELVVAFLDIAPGNPGHVLVVPAAHADDIVGTPAETAERMMVVAQQIARAIRRTDLKAEGFNFLVNTGRVAGQTVFHAHLHVVPRFAGDSGGHGDRPRQRLTVEELAPVAASIRAALAAMPAADAAR